MRTVELFICILKDYRRLDELLLAFLEIGVTGATVVEGRGMGQIIGSEVPIFASLRGLFPGSAQNSHIISCVIEERLVEPCFEKVERVLGPLNQAGKGIAFTVPIGQVRGLAPEIK